MLLPRILTAIVLIALVAGALFGLSGLWFALVALVLPVAGCWEWARLFGCSPRVQWLYAGATAVVGVGLALLPPMGWLWEPVLILASAFWLLVAPLWLYYRWQLRKPALALALGWLLLFAAWQGVLVWHSAESGPLRLLLLMIVVWIADSAAYFAGRMFGRHKLAPAISPGKTWEGAAGGLLAVTVYVFVVVLHKGSFGTDVLPFFVYLLLFLVALILTAVSIVGDLLESLFKRQAGLKDSGSLLPGHGGVLDRVDSLIAVLAVAGAMRWLLMNP